jgi:hypothetical protein
MMTAMKCLESSSGSSRLKSSVIVSSNGVGLAVFPGKECHVKTEMFWSMSLKLTC